MKLFFSTLLVLTGIAAFAQSKIESRAVGTDSLDNPRIDSLIKQKLIDLAMKNPEFAEANAMINSAQYELKGAKSSWLNAIVLSGNVNEFVINNTQINGIAASTLYPKYNIGVNIPLGLFTQQGKNIAKEKVKVYDAQKKVKEREIKKEVLSRYETFKEKKELYDLQKLINDSQYGNYQQRQKDFANGELRDIKEVNKEYQLWLQERSELRTKEKDLKIAQLEVEEIIGTNLIEVIQNTVANK